MKEVILHVGKHKTGSTSIQSALKGYSRNRVRTASFDLVNHSIPMYTIFSERRYHYHIWRSRGYSSQKINELKDKYLEILNRDVLDNNFDKLIISGEDIGVLSPLEKKELIEFFLSRNLTVKIVAYVREPLSWIVSSTQTIIRNGSQPQPPVKASPNFEQFLQPFMSILPKKNIFVYCFHDAINTHKDVVKHFAEKLELKLATTTIRDNVY